MIAAAWIWLSRPNVQGTDAFPLIERQTIYSVNDAGVGDLNGDGRPDRWTTNHSAAQWIALAGSDPDSALAIGLAQDSALPGMEQGALSVPTRRPVRIYMDDTRFVVAVDGIEQTVRGSFTIPWAVETSVQGNARTRAEPCDTMPDCHRIAFEIGNHGSARIEPVPAPSDGFAIRIDLADDLPLDQVQIGALALPPPAHSFTYTSKDRHGLALADPDGDGAPDIFVSRGGARGKLDQIQPDARDEWFEWSDQGFVEQIAQTGIEKAACPGRQTAWVDANRDGRPDLYQVCGRAAPPNNALGNRLYLQTADGRFTEAAGRLGLDLAGAGVFRFFRDARPDAPLALLWATRDALSLHLWQGERFGEVWSLPRRGSNTDKIVLTDLNGDGLWEALVFSPAGNLLLRPTADAPELLDLATLGLPAASADGSYLDINADGIRDVFTVPQGLFLGSADGFRHSDAIDVAWAGPGGDVRFAWFDADGDGDADLWLLKRAGARAPRPVRALYARGPVVLQHVMEWALGRAALRPDDWLSVLYDNRLATGGSQHLLQVGPQKATGIAGRPVAVTTVATATGDDAQTSYHLTGEADSSRFSQTQDAILVGVPPGRKIVAIRPVGSGN